MGSTSQGGTGVAPLVWGEIIEWANHFYSQHIVAYVEGSPVVIKKCTLEDYELEIIMQLSREYCQEYYEASDPNRECPKEIFLDEIDPVENSNAILEMFQKNWGNNRESMSPEVIR